MNKNLKLSKVCSQESYSWLQNWIKEQHPTNPYPMAVKDYFYRNTSHRQYLSKFIESVIIRVLKSKGSSPIKANDAGTYRDTSKVVDNVIHKHTIGSGHWTKAANVSPGRADIICFFNGSMCNYEVKVGKDIMSLVQKQERNRAILNGEKYYIITSVDDFLKTI